MFTSARGTDDDCRFACVDDACVFVGDSGSDADCDAGLRCVIGDCQAIPSCSSDDDCVGEERCVASWCATHARSASIPEAGRLKPHPTHRPAPRIPAFPTFPFLGTNSPPA
ncbi:MAG: hypothetical protein AB8I08_00500 [Sandaracinaceae bacterium]